MSRSPLTSVRSTLITVLTHRWSDRNEEGDMKQGLVAFCALGVGIHASFVARADIRPEQTHTALAAIEDAKTLVAAGRGQLLLVGSTLSTEQAPSENVVAILEYPEYPIVQDLKPGVILIL